MFPESLHGLFGKRTASGERGGVDPCGKTRYGLYPMNGVAPCLYDA
jgi:hypothetical protein